MFFNNLFMDTPMQFHYHLKKLDEKEQPICGKKGSTIKTDKLIDTSANNFKDFVRQSKVFVDKSLLVNLVAQNLSFISLTFPRKCGKSINLDMLKTFLEIGVDEKGNVRPLKESWSYKFFKEGKVTYENNTSIELSHPPAIAKNENIVRSYLGQYPVIYLDLSDFVPKSCDFEGFFESFQEHIAATFEAHKYVVEAFHNELSTWIGSGKKRNVKILLAKFNEYRTHQVHSEKGMITSLEFLSNVLKSYFEQPVYVLIDEYDAPMRKLCLEKPLMSDEAKKVIHFFRQFMISTFETNYSNMRMGIVTGVLDLNLFSNHSRSFSCVNYNLLNHNTRPPFGFTRLEANELLALYTMDVNIMEKKVDYYCRYCVPNSLKTVIYDPWAVVNFANKQTLVNVRSIADESMKLLMFEQKRKCIIIDILKNYTLYAGLDNLTLNSKDLILLNNVRNRIIPPPEYDEISVLIFKYLYACGFFHDGMIINDLLRDMTLELLRNGIPNTMGKELNLIDGVLVPTKAMRIAEIIFIQYFLYTGYKEFSADNGSVDEIENLHVGCFRRYGKPNVLKNFLHIHLFVSQFMKIIFHYDGGLNLRYYEYGPEHKPYLVFRKHDHRAIIEFECAKFTFLDAKYAARKALNRAKSFNVIFENEPSIRTSYVGIALNMGLDEHFSQVQVDTNPQYDENEYMLYDE